MYLYYPQYALFMILDLAYTSKYHYESNQFKSWPTYLSSLGPISLYTRRFFSSELIS